MWAMTEPSVPEVPEIDVVSSVGAGDSALAGFIMSMQQGRDLEIVCGWRRLSVTAAV